LSSNPLTLEEIAEYMGGSLHGDQPGTVVTGFATDSREVKSGDLFLAIRGANVDGHEFAQKAIDLGAAATLAEREVPGPYVLVDDVVQALARLAGHYRKTFPGPVVGITGSAGKTTTKEFVASALSPLGDVLKSEGNRNTEFTSPLVWTELKPEHRAVVVEMGMRGFGQITHLASFSKPTIALITNIGYSHIEMVGGRDGIAEAKSEILQALPEDGWAVLWQDDPYLGFLAGRAPRLKTFGFAASEVHWGTKVHRGGCVVLEYKPLSWSSCHVIGVCDGVPWEAELPAVGRHIALNAAAAVMVAVLAGVSAPMAAAAMQGAKIPPMRMEILSLNGATVVLDCYNASPPSMSAAIDTLAELPVEGRRRAVIGEMRELGEASEDAHRNLGRELAQKGIHEVVFYGKPTEMTLALALEFGADPTKYRYVETMDEISEFLSATEPEDAVLIKGSRSLELERALEPFGVKVGH
jgi:UDP-N-acetylmuramoyl-tripeptide--D-alanyl-D-alanine ligase